jgi:hypothetical protein
MRKKSNGNNTDFKTGIPEYNDQEILSILKKRKYYQPEAVKMAKEEAFKRNLINSEEDLLGDEYSVPPLKFGLFPKIESKKNKAKIRKSIARAVLIAGVLPTVWGFLTLNNGNNLEGGILVASGLLWIFLSAKLIQKVNDSYLKALFVFSALSFLYVGKVLLQGADIVFMDVFIIAVLYGLLLYGLIFIRKLRISE